MKKAIFSLLALGLFVVGAKAQNLGSTYRAITNYLEGKEGTYTGLTEDGVTLYSWSFGDGGKVTCGFLRDTLTGVLFKSPYAFSDEEFENIIFNTTRREMSNFVKTKTTSEGASFTSADGVYVILIKQKLDEIWIGYSENFSRQP
jgi:hypothetical protein